MFVLRRTFSKILFPKKNFSTNIYYEEIISQLPFSFTTDLTLAERVDTNFQTIRTLNKDLISDKDQINKVRNIYIQLFQTLTGGSDLIKLSKYVEPRLLSQIEESLKYLKDNSLKAGLLGSSILGKSEQEIQKRFDINQIGSLKVFNVDIVRKNNLYIHQYNMEKVEDRLTYTAKELNKEHLQVKSKKERRKDEMLENVKGNKKEEESHLKSELRKKVFQFAKVIGFMTPEDLDKPGAIQRMLNFKESLHGKLEGEDHILVEDYEVLSPLGLYIQDTKTGEIVQSEGKDGDLFRHFVRVEKKIGAKDAPSLRKQKDNLLTDIDFSFRGNPHTLVKNFAEC